MSAYLKLLAVCLVWLPGAIAFASETAFKGAPTDWTTLASREEIKPVFRYEPKGGREGREAFIIAGDNREGTSGWWQKTFAVEGGKTYRFGAWRKVEDVASPR